MGNGFIWIKTWISDSTGEDGSQTSGSMKVEGLCLKSDCFLLKRLCSGINPYPTAFPYGNGMVLHFYQQQESSTTKTVHKVINKGLKTYV